MSFAVLPSFKIDCDQCHPTGNIQTKRKEKAREDEEEAEVLLEGGKDEGAEEVCEGEESEDEEGEVARGLRRKRKKKRGLPDKELGIAMCSAAAHGDDDDCVTLIS